jgi:hypothetical protein
VLFVVTTVAAPQLFSRHFDLLLRAQEGEMQLSTADELSAQLADAGFAPRRPRPIAPGVPVVTDAGFAPRRPRPIAPGAPVVTVAATLPG